MGAKLISSLGLVSLEVVGAQSGAQFTSLTTRDRRLLDLRLVT
jgi:hypothetical protein